MSKTAGLTAVPPVYGALEMPTLIPPVEAYVATPCSWYCQRAFNAGCQHAPWRVSHATAAGTVAAPAGAGSVSNAATTQPAAARYRARARIVDLPLSLGHGEPRCADDAPDRWSRAIREHAPACAPLNMGRRPGASALVDRPAPEQRS